MAKNKLISAYHCLNALWNARLGDKTHKTVYLLSKSSTRVSPVPKRPLKGENANLLVPGDLLMSRIQKVNTFSLVNTMDLEEFLQLFHGFDKIKFLTSHQCNFRLTG